MGEPEQTFSRMLVLDGSNSLMRMKSNRGQWEAGDVRELQGSDYFLSNTYVNLFKNEIRHPATTHVKQEAEDETIDGDEGYVMEVDGPELENCASNWKAVVSLEKKRMWEYLMRLEFLLAPALTVLCCGWQI